MESLNLRDLDIILKVWHGNFSHSDALQLEQSAETRDKLGLIKYQLEKEAKKFKELGFKNEGYYFQDGS